MSYLSDELEAQLWREDCSTGAVMNRRRLLLVGVTAFGLIVSATGAHAQTSAKRHSPKIDRALSEALNAGGAATQHVIITLKPGYRAQMRKRLQDHGDVVQSEYASIDALVAEVHSADVGELAGRDEVAALSLDADHLRGRFEKSKDDRGPDGGRRDGELLL